MTEIHDVVANAGNTYKIRYKRTLKDVNGNDVTIFADAKLCSEVEIQMQIDGLNTQKTNIENQIAKLQTEIVEIGKVKV